MGLKHREKLKVQNQPEQNIVNTSLSNITYYFWRSRPSHIASMKMSLCTRLLEDLRQGARVGKAEGVKRDFRFTSI